MRRFIFYIVLVGGGGAWAEQKGSKVISEGDSGDSTHGQEIDVLRSQQTTKPVPQSTYGTQADQIEGIPGESTDDSHADQIEVLPTK